MGYTVLGAEGPGKRKREDGMSQAWKRGGGWTNSREKRPEGELEPRHSHPGAVREPEVEVEGAECPERSGNEASRVRVLTDHEPKEAAQT